MGVSSYSTNPALNTAINGIDISENCSAAGFNDALRQIMADIASWTQTNGVTYPITIADGGTGQTTATNAITALGGLPASYQHLPVATATGDYSIGTGNDGGLVRFTGASGTLAIYNAAATGLQVGAVCVVCNDGSVPYGIEGVGTALVWAANGATGARTLAIGGVATVMQVATDRWFIVGTGLT